MVDVKLSFPPSKEQVDEIIDWMLRNEDFTYGAKQILDDYEEDRLISLIGPTANLLGFCSLRIHRRIVYIDEFVLKKEYQRNGHGKVFMGLLEKSLSKKGIKLFELHAVNASNSFWEKCGFKEMTAVGTVTLYYKQIEFSRADLLGFRKHKISLWHSTLKRGVPVVVYEQELATIKAIPCHFDHQIEIHSSKNLVYKGKVKNCKEVLLDGNFLFI